MHEADEKALRQLLQTHLRNYPASAVQDIYKLLYQGAMGPGHLLHNPEAARRHLEQEWLSLPANIKERITEPISPDGKVFRIHLRPLKALLPNPDQLWQALFSSAQNWSGSIEQFIERWQYFQELVTKNLMPFPIHELTEVDDRARQNNYPAMHHSPRYRDAYYPAYRIILLQEFQKMDF